jgi:hypothetical protein
METQHTTGKGTQSPVEKQSLFQMDPKVFFSGREAEHWNTVSAKVNSECSYASISAHSRSWSVGGKLYIYV